MKKENKEKAKEISKIILLTLALTGSVFILAAFPGLAYVLKGVVKKEKYPRWKLNRTLKRLKDQNLIRLKQEGDKTLIGITKKGKIRALKYKFDELKIKKPKKWDRLWRVVIFDIPEEKKIARDALRRKLKDLGFYRLQKSVFIYPYPCRDEIDFVKEVFRVGEYIHLLVVKSVDNEENLRRHFKI